MSFKINLFLFLLLFSNCNKKSWVKLNIDEANSCIFEFAQHDSLYKLYPNKKLIYNEDIAISIAEVYLFDRFGKERIENEKPYKINIVNGCWVIEGNDSRETEEKAGSFVIVISSVDGKVIGLAHYK